MEGGGCRTVRAVLTAAEIANVSEGARVSGWVRGRQHVKQPGLVLTDLGRTDRPRGVCRVQRHKRAEICERGRRVRQEALEAVELGEQREGSGEQSLRW